MYISDNVIDKIVHLFDSVDTEDNKYTAEYLLNWTVTSIKSCQEHAEIEALWPIIQQTYIKYESNWQGMKNLPDIIIYGCSVHIFYKSFCAWHWNSRNHIWKIMKYFRNTHFAAAKYKQASGKALVMP